MKNAGDEIQFVRFSSDFKNRAGQKAAVFSFAEDLICFFILLPAVFLTLHLLKAGAAAFRTTLILPAGFWLLTLCRLKPDRLWKSILLTILSAAILSAIFLAAGNYAAAAVTFFAMIVSFVKTGRDFSRLYEKVINHDRKLKIPVYQKRAADSRDREEESAGPVYFSDRAIVLSGILNYISYLIALGFGFNSLAVFCVFDFAAVFALMMIYNQKSGAYCLSLWDKISKTENAVGGGKADKAGSTLLSFLTAVGTAVIALGLFFLAEAGGLSRIDNAFIGYLVRMFSEKPATPNESAPPPSSAPAKRGTEDILSRLKQQAPKESPIADIIKNVLTVILWCVVVAAAVLMIVAVGSAIIKFYRKLNRNINEGSRSLLPTKNAADKIRIHFFRRKNHFGIFSRTGNRLMIRRLFFLHIKKRRSRAVKSSDTPFEIGCKIADGSDIEKAAELYEKARYSNNACEDSDVKDMKQALKPDRQKVTPGKNPESRIL